MYIKVTVIVKVFRVPMDFSVQKISYRCSWAYQTSVNTVFLKDGLIYENVYLLSFQRIPVKTIIFVSVWMEATGVLNKKSLILNYISRCFGG